MSHLKPTLDDVPFGLGELNNQGDDRLRARRRYRATMVLAVAASYSIDTVFLVCFCLLGKLVPAVPIGYALAGLAHLLIFGGLHLSGASDKLRNPHLTDWQMMMALAVQLTAMVYAPSIRAYFLAIIFVVFAFGALRLTMRRVLVLWLLACAITTAVLLRLPAPQALTPTSAAVYENLTIGAAFSFVLLRCVLLNYYATHLRLRMMEQTVQLTERVRAAQELATRDALTGALNRNGILPLVDAGLGLVVRGTTPSAVAMVDIDHFKIINDDHGHPAGDRVLQQLVSAMESCLRPTDRIARYGGEEFLVYLPSTDLAAARQLSERLRRSVQQIDFVVVSRVVRLTISIGVTALRDHDTVDEALARADRYLYCAKNAGRNCVVGDEEPARVA